jgi:hypothetical protein
MIFFCLNVLICKQSRLSQSNPLTPPVTIAQTGGQPISATAQQYLVPGTHNAMYQVPTIQNSV